MSSSRGTPETGALKIRYVRENMSDWQSGRMRAHPIRWSGPYSIEVKGSSYPRIDGDDLQILVNVADEGAIAVIPGAFEERQGPHGPERQWLAARLSAIDRSGEHSVLAKSEKPPCRAGSPYEIKARVTDTEIVVTYNGQSILSGPKGKTWGHAAFKGGYADEVILEGKAEGSWIQGLVDQAREKNRAEFEKTFQLGRELPEWLGAGRPARRPLEAEVRGGVARRSLAGTGRGRRGRDEAPQEGQPRERNPVPGEPEARRAARTPRRGTSSRSSTRTPIGSRRRRR